MKIVVMCCTLNEERNIERYCEVYSRFADTIVICDGGSTDRTIELTRNFPKVRVVHFEELMDFDGIPWNPKGRQYNYGLAVALKLNPSWMIIDECDSVPTVALQESVRSLMLETSSGVIGVMRIYLLGEDKFYPSLSLSGYYGWAFRPEEVDASYDESTVIAHQRLNFPRPSAWRNIDAPRGLLHYGWPDEETAALKTKRYRAIGRLPPQGTAIPSDAGEPAPLPEWANWNIAMDYEYLNEEDYEKLSGGPERPK